MDGDDLYQDVASLGSASSVPDRCRNVIKELIDTESSYVTSLRDVLQGYQEPIKVQQHLPVKTEDVDTIFGNTAGLHAFSRRLLKLFEISQNDINGLASIFLERESDFKIYTDYCTNHPRSIKTLTSAQQQPTAAEFFYGCQLALGHMLPLSAFLLKPVQRILKYHLLLADLLKQYGKAVSTEDETYNLLRKAQITMQSVANYINASMRKEEAKELIKMIQGLTYDDEPGALVMEGVFRAQGAKVKRKVYIFEKLVVLTKRAKDNVNYLHKAHILLSQLTVVESPPSVRDPLAFQLCSSDGKTQACILYAKDAEQKNKVISQLRRLILEHLPNLPADARKKMMDSIESGGAVVPKGDAPSSPLVHKDRFQRQKVTKAKRGSGRTKKDSQANENHLEPSDAPHADLTPAGSVTSMDSISSTAIGDSPADETVGDESTTDPTIYAMSEDIYSSIYGTVGEQLQFCPSDDEHDDENAKDDDQQDDKQEEDEEPEVQRQTVLELNSSPKCEPLGEDLLDKPEVVVPMSTDYRFAAPRRSCEPRMSSSSLGLGGGGNISRILTSAVTQANTSTMNRMESVANTSRATAKTTRAEGRASASQTSIVQDKKQQEASMALTKGLVGRLVKKYTELTEEKPDTRSHRGSVASLTALDDPITVTEPLSPHRHMPRFRSASVGASPAEDSAPIRPKKASTNPALQKSKSKPPLRRGYSTVRKCTAQYPSLYAVSAELRRDGWRISRKVNSRRTSAAYSSKTTTYINPKGKGPVSSGRVRDLIAKFSVQPM
ncbi:pleckstrin homology domain-containing family G member 3-like [Sycon ciliatum]|uniref:pleckstrin homology domain-containing family G member 3-like n=1 Tax=Sycon ciliatum TaxID=27933 RepID=UPI0020A88A12|eukprot:scpid19504/ scgid26530/ Pleckstrin homology domain-containing family G member 1